MTVISDCRGLEVRLTDERLAHILEHPEMVDRQAAIAETLKAPTLVIQSISDDAAHLYYRFYSGTRVGDKFVCVGENQSRRRVRVNSVFDRQAKEGNGCMERKHVKVWYDAEGDYLEVLFERKEGYFRETGNDQVMEKVDTEGNVIGFSVLKVSALKEHPLEVALGA